MVLHPAVLQSEKRTINAGALRVRSIFLHVTKLCNIRCAYCYFSATKPMPDEMRTDEFQRLWPEIITLQPEKVIFTGGEPLVRPDILELLEGLRAADANHGVLLCLNTNGYRVTPTVARRLVGLVDEVRVSIDAMPLRNDRLRGQGNFDAAMKAFDIFYSVGFEPKALVTVSARSLRDVEELLGLLVSKGITRINLNGFRPIGRGYGQSDWLPDHDSVRAAVDQARRRWFDLPPRETIVSEAQRSCGVGQFLNIFPNGDVFPCHVLTSPDFRCGNVREDSLSKICGRGGLLHALYDLDFRELAQDEIEFETLTRPGVCLGDVYVKTKSSPIWLRELPLDTHGKHGTDFPA